MFHGLDNTHLYCAYLFECEFADAIGNTKTFGGTGFWVKDGQSISLVTNRHVLDIQYKDANYKDWTLNELVVVGRAIDPATGKPDLEQRLRVANPDIRYSKIPENDVAVIGAPAVDVIGGGELKPINCWIDRSLLATTEEFETNIQICDFVAFPGYPPWHDKRERRPILRTGAVASDPRYNYSWTTESCGDCIAYEAFSYGGSSGSPVFAVQKGPEPGPGISFPGFRELRLIGINAGHLDTDKDAHSGISYMFKSSAIIDILNDAK